MTNWFDAWAKSSAKEAGRTEPADASPSPAPAGINRREVLKRAGIIGAATVWATPVIQSVSPPAYALLGSILPQQCTAPDGTCGDLNDGCTSVCPPDQNKRCADNNDCDGTCNTANPKVCVKSAVGGHCTTNTGCTQNRCNLTNSTCEKGAAAAPCTADSQCKSGKCLATNVCGTTANGPCYTSGDCNSGKFCVNGTCT